MQYFAVHGDIDCFGRIDNPADIFLGNFAIFDGDDAIGVQSFDMATGDTCIDGLDFASGHQFSFFDSFANSTDSAFNIDDNAFAKAAGRAGPDADNINAVFRDVADNGTNLGCADVETDDQVIPFCC